MGKKRTSGARKLAVVLALVAALGAGAYIFTSGNTFGSDQNAAGEGAQNISGYTIGTPQYTLLSSDPSKIASFSFTISTVTTGTTVKASLVPGTWIACSLGTVSSGSATPTCTFASGSEPTVNSVSKLDVVAVN